MVLRILKYLSRLEKTMIFGVLLTTMAQVWLELKMPDYMSEITRLVQTNGSLMRDIWHAGGMMLLCALGSMIATMCSGFLCARIAAGYSMRLREKVFRKTQTFSMEELNRFSVASLITRSTNDVTQVQSLVAMGMQILLKAPLTAIWALIKIFSKQQEWTITAWVCVAILLVMNAVLIVLTEPKFRSMQTLTDQLNRVTREHLTGLRVVRAYNAEPYQEQKFAEANDALTKTGLFTGRLMTVIMIATTIGTVFWMPFCQKLDARQLFVINGILGIIGYGMTAASLLVMENNTTVFLIGSFIASFGDGINCDLAPTLTARVVDYGEYVHHERQEGLCFSGKTVVQKVVSALCTAILGFALAGAGYVSGYFPESAGTCLIILLTVVPTVAYVLMLVSSCAFKLDRAKMDEINEELERRRQAASN